MTGQWRSMCGQCVVSEWSVCGQRVYGEWSVSGQSVSVRSSCFSATAPAYSTSTDHTPRRSGSVLELYSRLLDAYQKGH